MAKVCCVCQKPFEEGGKVFTLTAAEKKAIGKNASDEVAYCSACIKVMEDPHAGAQLLKGMYEMQLREAGVPESSLQRLASRFYKILVKGNKGKLH